MKVRGLGAIEATATMTEYIFTSSRLDRSASGLNSVKVVKQRFTVSVTGSSKKLHGIVRKVFHKEDSGETL